MYLLLFCMQVQNTQADNKTSKGESAKSKRICFRVELDYPQSKCKTKTGKDDYKLIVEKFKELSELLLKIDKTQFKCNKNKKMKCKKCYCVCCKVQLLSVQQSTLTPPYNKGNQT
jgi:hypothetical protein